MDYWDHSERTGGQVLSYDTRGIEKLHLFVRRGAILAMWPEADWIAPGGQYVFKSCSMLVYRGEGAMGSTPLRFEGATITYFHP